MQFLKIIFGLGLCLVYAVGLILVALVVATFIAVLSAHAPEIVAEILALGLMVFLAVAFLVAVGWLQYRVWLWIYLRALPKIEAPFFCLAFPGYEESFLLEVRQIIATYLEIATEKVPIELIFGHNSPLGGKQFELFRLLFTRFRPTASPEWQMWSLENSRLRPTPSYVVEFPTRDVRTMSDLLREVDELRKGKVSRPWLDEDGD